MTRRRRYVLAGTGGRGIAMFARPLLETFTRHCELVGLFDSNPLRIGGANALLGAELPGYTDYRRMLRELDPDAVIVATRDSTHARYIVAALAAGKRVISEKPLCTDAAQARAILAAAQRFRRRGGACWVTHNMRYGPAITEMKRLIDAGAIGGLRAVNFHESLDRRHGADYFRRWHRMKANSGGLLIHKASHHFDALNWLVGSIPDSLVARGGTVFYGRNGPFRGRRCSGCRHARRCDFFADMWGNERNRRLYLEAEAADGYLRDGCVFDPEVDIEDQAGVLYSYRNGVQAVYSLTAFASYEGCHILVEGTRGRLELREVIDTRWAAGNVTVHGLSETVGEELALYSPAKGYRRLPIPKVAGSHGGADPQLQHDFFGRPWDAPPTARMAPVEQAVQAILIGHAANASIAKGGAPVRVQGLLKKG
ncbi:MAG TPA: Gfo/Idh/MocA family oxidoreductase [Planctomycetota bacterium]|nr:Gfo/Idh/MocA family oxidoreductase [Planctomycetota bacterium]